MNAGWQLTWSKEYLASPESINLGVSVRAVLRLVYESERTPQGRSALGVGGHHPIGCREHIQKASCFLPHLRETLFPLLPWTSELRNSGVICL